MGEHLEATLAERCQWNQNWSDEQCWTLLGYKSRKRWISTNSDIVVLQVYGGKVDRDKQTSKLGCHKTQKNTTIFIIVAKQQQQCRWHTA